MNRQEEIVEWLSRSKLIRLFQTRQGFFVSKGRKVRLQSGTVVDIVEWLLQEGITDGLTINGYNIVHTKPGGNYTEKLSFFKVVEDIIDVPFALDNEKNEDELT